MSVSGDYKAISLDVVNAGSIDAELSSIVLSGLSSEQDVYLNYYIQYDDGSSVSSGDTLDAEETKSILLVIEFDKAVIADELPTTDQSLSLTFSMIYVQA